MQHVLGLDHVVILVRDLAAAEARLARLGFRPTPRGVHSAHMGTANTTVVFGDGTYLEALGVLQPTDHNLAVRTVLAEREGPYGLAFKTEDAGAAAAEFAAAGIGPAEALEFARPVELPSGPREAAFRVARTDPAHTPGAWLFVCQHRTPEVTWRVDHLEQENGACGIAEVIGIADDLRGVKDAYGRIFGDRLQAHERRPRDRCRQRPDHLPAACRVRRALCAVRRRDRRDLAAPSRAAAADLRARADPGGSAGERRPGQARRRTAGLLIAPEEACGTILEFAAS